jgi:hypothetical protein
MPARVYECGKSEAEALKKLLGYDPYLAPGLVPPSKSEQQLKAMSEEERKKVEEEEAKSREAIKKLHEDKYANVIFARQTYSFIDGAVLDLDANKSYLYLDASEQFLALAEERFKNEFKTVKKASKADEDKTINKVKTDEEKANAGFGAIFGS